MPEILARKLVHSGYLSVETLRIRLDDAAVVDREVEHHGDAVALLPYDEQRGVALTVRLFRAPVFEATGDDALEEACAGMVDAGEDAPAAARREALEELGLRCRSPLQAVGQIWSSPGVSTERVSLFLVSYTQADRVAEGGGVPEEHEGITVIERPLKDLFADARAGRVADGKLLTLIFAAALTLHNY